MNSDYEQNQQSLLFFVIFGPKVSIISSYIWMDSRLKGLSIESKNIRNGVRMKKL